LRVDPIVIEEGGHFNESSGYKTFPELIEHCFQLKVLKNKPKKDEPWHISAARYCIDNADRGFSEEDFKRYVKEYFPQVHKRHITQFFDEEIRRPSGRNHSRFQRGIIRYSPPLDLVSKVVEFDELKEARKNAVEARWLSVAAIIISLISLLLTFFNEYTSTTSI
jgi:hypothetical protein